MSGVILAVKQDALSDFIADCAYGFIATGDPGTTSTVSNEASGGSPAYARVALTWGSPDVNGIVEGVALGINVPAGTYTYGGAASASSGANQRFSLPLDAVFTTGAQSTYDLTLRIRVIDSLG